MRIIEGATLGIDQGSVMLFSDFQDGGAMWTGSGTREVRHAVRFARPFRETPAVILGIGLWDTDRSTNLRADLTPEAISPGGFVILFRTWGDTRLARLRADWTALGQARHPDDWAV